MEEYWLSERSRAAWSLRETEQKIAQCNEDHLAALRVGNKEEAQEQDKKLLLLIQARKRYIDAYRDADGEATRAAWFRLTGR
jgi:hypothetical protein